MIARFWGTLVLSLFSLIIAGQTSIENTFQEILSKEEYKHASVGVLVVDPANDEEILKYNPDQLLIPASTMKIITTATALRILGPEYRFITEIGYTGQIDREGILHGDIVVKGGADPALGSEYFQKHYYDFLNKWSRALKSSGIKKVDGNLVLDGSVYDNEKVPATWIWEDLGNYYGAGANAFTVYDNMFRITFQSSSTPGKQTRIINYYPKIKGIEMQNEVLSSEENADNAYVFGSPLDKVRVIRGTIPAGRKAFTIKASVQHPEEILAADFWTTMAKDGIFISGEAKYKKGNAENYQMVYFQESPKLAEIAKVLNYESVNLFAEHFLKQLAVEKYGIGDREKAIEIVQEYWKQKLSEASFFMEDGSGLSHFNAVSPRFFAQLLTFMDGEEAFVQSLPRAGDGTLYQFSKEHFPGNTLEAKSGSMTRVRCYSGYLTTDAGRRLVFSIMFNHFSGSHSALIKDIDKLLFDIKTSY
ncbi:MAG TPA: D-alanyl-D-alanine carboxypeptidase/D-alanyl-D-alanine-endopeptidase [Draconibacterium sp.]|nr:D-alanyl-D-alanine carboxypeptidase/D-alanyl-D-alanine-endopeptidase [Draconibacterium sp.]